MSNFSTIIASPPDREKLVAEIWYNNIMIAEVNQEKEQLEIILYTSKKSNFELDELIMTLKIAKDKLLNKSQK